MGGVSLKGRSGFLQKLFQFGEDRGPLPKDAMPEGKQRSPEASKALAQLYNTTIQYFSSLEASEDSPPFQKQNLDPSAGKHEMYQASPLILVSSPPTPLRSKRLYLISPDGVNKYLFFVGFSLCPKTTLFFPLWSLQESLSGNYGITSHRSRWSVPRSGAIRGARILSWHIRGRPFPFGTMVVVHQQVGARGAHGTPSRGSLDCRAKSGRVGCEYNRWPASERSGRQKGDGQLERLEETFKFGKSG